MLACEREQSPDRIWKENQKLEQSGTEREGTGLFYAFVDRRRESRVRACLPI